MEKQSFSSVNSLDKTYNILSIVSLIICCIFTILGIVSNILLFTNNYCLYGELLNYGETGTGSIHFSIGFLLLLTTSFFVCLISSIISCLCLAKTSKQKINISTIAVTTFNFLFCTISFLINLISPV